jgi:hypothetical protein
MDSISSSSIINEEGSPIFKADMLVQADSGNLKRYASVTVT